MTMPQAELMQQTTRDFEAGEVKRPVYSKPVEESLSEWELARMTSKTWSMEQD